MHKFRLASLSEATQFDASLEFGTGFLHSVRKDSNFLFVFNQITYPVNGYKSF